MSLFFLFNDVLFFLSAPKSVIPDGTIIYIQERGREGEREGERERGKEGERERDGGREGEREEGSEGGGREGGK